ENDGGKGDQALARVPLHRIGRGYRGRRLTARRPSPSFRVSLPRRLFTDPGRGWPALNIRRGEVGRGEGGPAFASTSLSRSVKLRPMSRSNRSLPIDIEPIYMLRRVPGKTGVHAEL